MGANERVLVLRSYAVRGTVMSRRLPSVGPGRRPSAARRLRRLALISAALSLAVAAPAAGAGFRYYGPTWHVAPLTTPTWSFDCRTHSANSWADAFIVRRNLGGGSESWGYSYYDNAQAPRPFTMTGFPYNGNANPGRIPTGYIMVTNWSFETNNYTNIAVCDKAPGAASDNPHGSASARTAAAGTVSGREEDGTPFVYSTRTTSVRASDGTLHLFVTRPLRPRGVTDGRLSCPAGQQIVRAFSHVGFYTSRALNDRGEEVQRVRESRTALDEGVRLQDRRGETDVVGLARGRRAILYEDVYCARG